MVNNVPHWIALEFSWPYGRRVSIEVRRVLSDIDFTTVAEPSEERHRDQHLELAGHVFNEVAPVVLEEAKAKYRSSKYDLTGVLHVIDFLIARLRNSPSRDQMAGLLHETPLKTVSKLANSLKTELYEITRELSVRFLQGMDDDGQNILLSLQLLMDSLEGICQPVPYALSERSLVEAQHSLMNAFLWSQVDDNTYDDSDLLAANVKYADHLANALHTFIASSADMRRRI